METSINYPDSLPAPLWGSNKYTPVSPNQRTSMASGRARQRRQFSSVPVMRSASWVMTDVQARQFELWFKVTLKDGGEWFNIKLRHPLGYQYYVCRIVNIYDGPTAWGVNRWRFDATLELWERPLMDDAWALLPGFMEHPEIFDIAMNREWPEA